MRGNQHAKGYKHTEEFKEKSREANTGDRSHRFKDGRTNHPQYIRWLNMTDRCHREEHPGYSDYGGRGITVYQEWRDDPFVFFAYLETLGPCPPGHSLDRINNDGNYEPGNIRWASIVEQNNNQRKRARCSFPS
jgi:hypothetical protein